MAKVLKGFRSTKDFSLKLVKVFEGIILYYHLFFVPLHDFRKIRQS